MSWDTCKKEHVRKVEVDNEKINSILEMSSARLDFLKKQKADEKTASIITEGYYEVIKELLTALLLKNSLKSSNHECLISFFKNKFPKYEYEVNILYELKSIRNRISYDGFFVDKTYLDKNKMEFEHIIDLLKGLI